MTIEFKGGRLPNDPTKARLKLRPLLEAAVTYPENKDWYSRVSSWPMYLNDRYGDCTCATVGHIIQQLTTYGEGKTETISDADVIKAYSAVSGFNPATGANDDGAVIQDVLNYWRKQGIGGHKIVAFAEVDVNNMNEVRQAVNLFGNVYLGINFPNTAMDQFNAGKPWDYVRGAYSEGGHAINAVYYDVSDGKLKVITWGRVQEMTQAFWDKYVDEAWVVISEEWLDANRRNPDGVDVSVLGEQFTEITGEASPFPVTPSPEPKPVAPSVDDDFAAVASEWLSTKHYFYKDFQKKLQAWLDNR